MKIFVILCMVAVSACYTVTHQDGEFVFDRSWQAWKSTHKKSYSDLGEEKVRYTIWADNVQRVTDYNMKSTNLLVSVNQFSDMTNLEFKQQMNGYLKPTNKTGSMFLPPNFSSVPDTVDWRDKGYVTPVKNQGACGSCWTFSVTGCLEGQLFKKNGRLVSLSEQDLLDCSSSVGNLGCRGGYKDKTFTFIKSDGGIDTESSYPYEAKVGNCRFDRQNVAGTDTGFVSIAERDENALKIAVATVGPISIAIQGNLWTFQHYHSGVYDDPSCVEAGIDHAVLAVGYGTDQGKDYWLVKNSWGESWGMNGYVKMSRNKNNQCGIATDASYPLV